MVVSKAEIALGNAQFFTSSLETNGKSVLIIPLQFFSFSAPCILFKNQNLPVIILFIVVYFSYLI